MESRGRCRTVADILEEIVTGDNSSWSPDSEIDSLDIDYDANSSSDSTEEHQRRQNETDERNEAPSSTTLYDLPLEMLDIMLQKSYLHWILNSSTQKSDKEVIKTLMSVDVCFNRRIARQRFKNTIWRYLKEFYGKTNKISAIIRNNRNYLLEHIQPSDELITSLLSLNCITEEQSHFIRRQRSTEDKNAELLYVMTSFDEKKFSDLFKCLRRTNQHTVAKIMKNGGGVIKVDVQSRGAKTTASLETQLIHQAIEILSSQLDRETVVVWIWCHLQTALEHIERLYESNLLKYAILTNIQPSISKEISIDWNQFKKTIVVCPISINFTQRINVGRNENVWGVTKSRNEIYVLCQSGISSEPIYILHVFEDQISFRLQKKIQIREVKDPVDIGSSEKENCLYIADYKEKCVWKVKKERNDQHKIIKWLITENHPWTLSVSSGGQLLVVYDSWSILMIYGSDAKLIRSIQLSKDIKDPRHAVETSIGNFIIIDWWWGKEDKGESWSSGRKRKIGWGISELTRDGQMVIRRFIPSNETQELNYPRYLSIDSDDRVFVADFRNNRVILLDSDLKWNRVLCPTKEKDEDTMIRYPYRLCCDEENKQLIVVGYTNRDGVSVYTLKRN